MRHLTSDERHALSDELWDDTVLGGTFDYWNLIADNARIDDDGTLVPSIDELKLMLGEYARGPVCATATELEARYAYTLSVCGVLPAFYDLAGMVHYLTVVLPNGKYVGVSDEDFWDIIEDFRLRHTVEVVLHKDGNWTPIEISSEADLASVYRREDAPEPESAMQYTTIEEMVQEYADAGYMIRMP